MSGVYCLVVELGSGATIEIGALGKRSLSAGGYTYVGSARGPGGYARLDRHRAVAAGTHPVRHWHVDYLLGHPSVSVVGDVRVPEAAECRVAGTLTGDAVTGFGCSDCGCHAHLFGYDNADAALADAEQAVESQSGTSR